MFLLFPVVGQTSESVGCLMMSYICVKALQLLCAEGPLAAGLTLTSQKKGLKVCVSSFLAELEQELHKTPQRTCIVKMMSTRNLWKNIVVLCVNS